MCSDCQRRAETNPLRVLDCKVPQDQPIIEKLPRMADYLDENCRAHFADVQKILAAMEVPFTIDHRLVRGLDYYTRTAFEFTHGALGAQNAILGGGRYDGLSESLGGPPAPGIGFAIGEDRLVMTLQESAGVAARPADVYIAPLGAGMNLHAAKLARELRKQGVVVIAGDESFKLKKSLETASKLGVRFALILGENEVNSGQFALKNLSTGEQAGVARARNCSSIETLKCSKIPSQRSLVGVAMFNIDKYLRRRVSIHHVSGASTIRIERQNSRGQYFWMMCLGTVVFSLFCNILFDTARRHPDNLLYILVVLALGLTCYFIGIAIAVWGAFGVEEIVVKAGAIHWKRTALKWSRTRDIPVERITIIRAITPWHGLHNTVEITMDGNRQQIGDRLLHDEAIELARHLRKAVGLDR